MNETLQIQTPPPLTPTPLSSSNLSLVSSAFSTLSSNTPTISSLKIITTVNTLISLTNTKTTTLPPEILALAALLPAPHSAQLSELFRICDETPKFDLTTFTSLFHNLNHNLNLDAGPALLPIGNSSSGPNSDPALLLPTTTHIDLAGISERSDEHTRDEVREMATDIEWLNTTTKLTHSILLARS